MNLFKKNISRLANSLNPDQDGHSVGRDLGPNCLHRLSADNKSPLGMKELKRTQCGIQFTKIFLISQHLCTD